MVLKIYYIKSLIRHFEYHMLYQSAFCSNVLTFLSSDDSSLSRLVLLNSSKVDLEPLRNGSLLSILSMSPNVVFVTNSLSGGTLAMYLVSKIFGNKEFRRCEKLAQYLHHISHHVVTNNESDFMSRESTLFRFRSEQTHQSLSLEYQFVDGYKVPLGMLLSSRSNSSLCLRISSWSLLTNETPFLNTLLKFVLTRQENDKSREYLQLTERGNK
ncbi:hypothetical protein BpHYR1_017790 [Brachionus plicatilis]|uniref:Uncharacterized protein n=1 Tax=Brachionus plicatilis TaxID=10195 RepID=A0A3M7QUK3_BRAPC|nr:hypothetical protein BpHYR1_017790 [Brachionus plicatilis]